MCRPPCCNHRGDQGTGIAAVALLMLAALIAAKVGPIVAKIVHVVLDVIRLVALTTGLVVALVAITWAAIAITRWQLRHSALTAARTRVVTTPTVLVTATQGNRPADCMACGGTGSVLRAIGSGRYQPGECPVCEPVSRAG